MRRKATTEKQSENSSEQQIWGEISAEYRKVKEKYGRRTSPKRKTVRELKSNYFPQQKIKDDPIRNTSTNV